MFLKIIEINKFLKKIIKTIVSKIPVIEANICINIKQTNRLFINCIKLLSFCDFIKNIKKKNN